jgi:hypothetical protein
MLRPISGGTFPWGRLLCCMVMGLNSDFCKETVDQMTFSLSRVGPNFIKLFQVSHIMPKTTDNNGRDNKKRVDFF